MFGPLILALAAAAAGVAGDPANELLPPVRLEAAGKPIDTAVGHAAPFVGDFDGDGVQDLLVGQFGEGILWIYNNVGSNAQPSLPAGWKLHGSNTYAAAPSDLHIPNSQLVRPCSTFITNYLV